MRIELNAKATVNAEEMARQLNRSVNEVVNLLLCSVSAMDVAETITVKLEREPDAVKPNQPKVKIIKRANAWHVNI